MASFKVLFVLFVTLFALAFAAEEEVQREKKQIYAGYTAYSTGAWPHGYAAPAAHAYAAPAAHGYAAYPYAGYHGIAAPHQYYHHY